MNKLVVTRLIVYDRFDKVRPCKEMETKNPHGIELVKLAIPRGVVSLFSKRVLAVPAETPKIFLTIRAFVSVMR